MLEYLVIFGKGGAILWTFGQLFSVKSNPVNVLVQQCLLEDRGGENKYVYRPPSGVQYTLQWTLDNRLDLIFVAAYQHMLTIPYVDVLLTQLKEEFAYVHKPDLFDYKQFDDTYLQLVRRMEGQALKAKMRAQGKHNGLSINGHRQCNGSLDGDSIQDNKEDSETAPDGDSTPTNESSVTSLPSDQSPPKSKNSPEATSRGAFNREVMLKKFAAKSVKKAAAKTPTKPVKPVQNGKKGKAPRNWNGSDPDLKTLDFSKPSSVSNTSPAVDPTLSSATQSRMDTPEAISYADDDAAIDAALRGSPSPDAPPPTLLGSLLTSLKTNIVGKEALSAEDVAAAVEPMKKRLQERNVSAPVTAQVSAAVAASLEGKRLASFTGVSALVRSTMEDAITRILSPKRSIDVVAEIRASKARGKPYSMVFVGVNGVGKSTNLAKVAYWLRQQDLRVMIAACDTFRSGAVEQLKTHCNRLGVPLFDRGYDKDPTNVAAEAIRQAERDGVDVVLVDTAGRMQDNEPLMHALSMLINKNDPNLVLFVGEALVGNDGVNQLIKFNQRLADLSPPGRTPRLIDGILVTKFDTIDKKVGAVLSMAYSSGAPIMFVGCGQTYVDLMRLDVRAVVKALLK